MTTSAGALQDYIYQYCRIAHEFNNRHSERKIGKTIAELIQDLQTLKTDMQKLTNFLNQEQQEVLTDYIFRVNQLSDTIRHELPALTNVENAIREIASSYRP